MTDQPRSRRVTAFSHISNVASDHPILAAIVLIVVVTGVFMAFPGLDLWMSGLFYRPDDGFFLSRLQVLKWIRDLGFTLGVFAVAWLILQLVLKVARPDHPSYVPPSATAFLLSTLVLAPVLVVNALFKDYWGRPRPRQVEPFGGDAPFVDIWHITDHCDTNCSFVSGETSFAVWMIAFALVVPVRFRFLTAIATIAFAFVLSFNRILFGGHFLSDVLLAAAITLLIIAIGYRLFITHPPPWLANQHLEAGLTRFGFWLQRRKPL